MWQPRRLWRRSSASPVIVREVRIACASQAAQAALCCTLDGALALPQMLKKNTRSESSFVAFFGMAESAQACE